MKKPLQPIFLLLVLVGIYLPVSAIVVDDYSVAITNPPAGNWDLNWDYVYKYKGSSSVAVGSHWLLTAAHVADDTSNTAGFSNVVVNGVIYYPKEIIFHLGSDDPEHLNRADIALVRFDKEFPGHYPLYTGTFPKKPWFGTDKRLNAVLVGYGTTGTVSSAFYTAREWNDVPNGRGIKRWGSNKIDGPDTQNYNVGGTTGTTYNDGIKIMFSSSETTYEAGVGTYDSGGGTFVEESGVWKLAGINTIRYGGPTNFTGTFGVSVPAYETWVTQTLAAADGDDDADGIPNWWEEQYGSTTGVVASTDQDGDGVIGTDEYTADTDPTNSNLFWQAEGTFSLTNQTFTFDGSTARKYQVLYTTNDLADPGLTWVSNGTPVWGSGAGTEIVVTNTEETVFYRVWVTLP